MIMVNTFGAFVLFVLLCAAWLSTARLHPGAEINATAASMISAEAASTKSQPAIIFDDENVRNKGKIVKPWLSSSSSLSSNHEAKRQRRLRRHWSDEVDEGFVAFSADYHGPRHHPPKNN